MVSGRLAGMATAAHQVEGGIEGTDWEVFTRDPAISRRVSPRLIETKVNFVRPLTRDTGPVSEVRRLRRARQQPGRDR